MPTTENLYCLTCNTLVTAPLHKSCKGQVVELSDKDKLIFEKINAIESKMESMHSLVDSLRGSVVIDIQKRSNELSLAAELERER